MESGVATPNPITRNTQREVLPPTFTAVDEKRFESEIKRIDATIAEDKKNLTRIEKAVNDLRGEMNTRFDKMEKSIDSRFAKTDSDIKDLRGEINELRRESNSHFLWMMGVLVVAVLIPIALQYFAK
jgi:septal ring factor EnvC (AmiA/AmiB activator)